MEIGGKQFEVNNSDKIFFPDRKYSKSNVMEYYHKIAPFMLPHLKDRVCSMLRFPDGIKGKKFFQKEVPDYFPEWITRQTVKKKEGGEIEQVVCDNEATLVYLASQACLTPHTWGSQVEQLSQPDKLIFDLDPGDDDFSKVKLVAEAIHDFFAEKLDVKTFVMTTGSTGLHVAVPLKPELNFEKILNMSQQMAAFLEEDYPKEMTTETHKNKRGNKIYLDVMRNAYGQTSVAPYALRSLKGAPVATPLGWDEISGIDSSQNYTLSSIFKRLGQKEDPWKDFYNQKISSKRLFEKFQKLN